MTNKGKPTAPEDFLLEARKRLDAEEETRLSPHACLSRRALRRQEDPGAELGHRQHFALDADRVLHSLAYTRYIDKTQVFSLLRDDRITHRVLHVQLVSKIGRTVGRHLGLNEDLIEAMSLAHDIGHPPFGHDGETFLSQKCLEHGIGPFLHNVQSVHFLERLEKGGRGLNLSLQVLDGVLCHDGEVHTPQLAPERERDFAGLDRLMAAKTADPGAPLIPMTLEGCVLRIVDTVAYVGRDLEDAIRLKIVRRQDLPREVSRVLGDTNGTIVYRLVEDLIVASRGRGRVGFSPEIGAALADLKRFNLERIYLNPVIKSQHPKIRAGFHRLFDQYLEDLARQRRDSRIFRDFLDQMAPDYLQARRPAEAVRDFIAGMTDDYFLRCYRELVWPSELPLGGSRGI